MLVHCLITASTTTTDLNPVSSPEKEQRSRKYLLCPLLSSQPVSIENRKLCVLKTLKLAKSLIHVICLKTCRHYSADPPSETLKNRLIHNTCERFLNVRTRDYHQKGFLFWEDSKREHLFVHYIFGRVNSL